MNVRRLLILGCAACASSGCGGQTITLAEGRDGASGPATQGSTGAGCGSTPASGSTTTGAGGATTSGSPDGGLIPPDRLDLIDDMEDMDERLILPPRDGRTGRWNTYNDGTSCATQWPDAKGFFVMSAIEPARGSSAFAARTLGQGFSAMPSGGWATMELSFIGASDGQDAGLLTANYDAHRYQGITFYAKAGAGTQTEVRVNLTTPQTLPQGGTCKICYDSFGATISLTTDWQQYVLSFGALQQRGFGDPVPVFDAYHVYTVTFGFAGPSPFDLWIDDIAFYE